MVCIIYCLKHNKLAGSESIIKSATVAWHLETHDTITKYFSGQTVTLTQTLGLLVTSKIPQFLTQLPLLIRTRQLTCHWKPNVSVSSFKGLAKEDSFISGEKILWGFRYYVSFFLTNMSKHNAVSSKVTHRKIPMKLTEGNWTIIFRL